MISNQVLYIYNGKQFSADAVKTFMQLVSEKAIQKQFLNLIMVSTKILVGVTISATLCTCKNMSHVYVI